MFRFFGLVFCALFCTTVPANNGRDDNKRERVVFNKEALLPKEIKFVDDDSVPDEVDE